MSKICFTIIFILSAILHPSQGDFVERKASGDHFRGTGCPRGCDCLKATHVIGEIFADSRCVTDYKTEFDCELSFAGSTTIKYIDEEDIARSTFHNITLENRSFCSTSTSGSFWYGVWDGIKWIEYTGMKYAIEIKVNDPKVIMLRFLHLWAGHILRIRFQCQKEQRPQRCVVVKHAGNLTYPITGNMFTTVSPSNTTPTTTKVISTQPTITNGTVATPTTPNTTLKTTTKSTSSSSKPTTTAITSTTTKSSVAPTTVEIPTLVHRSSTGDVCTDHKICNCRGSQDTFFAMADSKDRCVGTYKTMWACDIASNDQYKILTITKDGVLDKSIISIGKSCVKQPVFGVFVWDKEWKTLHSSAANSLFQYSKSEDGTKTQIEFTKYLEGVIIKLTVQCQEQAVKSNDCFVLKFNGTSNAEKVDFDAINKALKPITKKITATNSADDLRIIVGCAVGGFVVLLLIVVVVLVVIRRRRLKNNKNKKSLPLKEMPSQENRRTLPNPSYGRKLDVARNSNDDQNRLYAEIDDNKVNNKNGSRLPSNNSLPRQNEPIYRVLEKDYEDVAAAGKVLPAVNKTPFVRHPPPDYSPPPPSKTKADVNNYSEHYNVPGEISI